jgi:hypothetical protein
MLWRREAERVVWRRWTKRYTAVILPTNGSYICTLPW